MSRADATRIHKPGKDAVAKPSPDPASPNAAASEMPLDPGDREPATILFAISQRDRQAPKLAWSTDLPIVHMLADLLTASSAAALAGTPAPPDADGVLAATVPSPLQAVTLAIRALKMAIAYSRYPGSTIRFLSIAIVTSSKKGPSPENAVRTLLKTAAAPWQIVLAGETPKHLSPIPGLHLRKVAPPSGQRFEMQEIVLQHIERPEVPPEGALAPPAPRTGQTPTAHTQSSLPQYPTGQPRIQTGGTSKVQTGSSPIAHPISAPRPVEKNQSPEAIVPFSRRDQEPESSGGSKKLIFGGIAAVLILGGGFAAKSFLSGSPAPPAAVAPATSTPAATPAEKPIASPINPTSRPASPKPEPAPVAAPRPTREIPAAKPAEEPVRAAAPKPEPPPRPAKAEKEPAEAPARDTSTRGGFNAEQLRAILDKADGFAANGNYDQAIKFYNVVLASDPGNGRARSGKERANTNKNLQ